MPFGFSEPVRFIAGSYTGAKGYLNQTKGETPEYVYVFVDAKGDGVFKGTRVKKTSIADDSQPRPEPTSLEEACLQQHAKVEKALRDCCKLLAQCDLGDTVSQDLFTVFVAYYEEAVEVQTKLQLRGKARYYKTFYDAPEWSE